MIAERCLLLWNSPQTGKTAAPPRTTCQALPLPPVQAPPHLLHTTETAFDLAVPHSMLRAGHSHNGRALCAVVAECCLLLFNPLQTGKNRIPHKPPAQPCRSLQLRPQKTCCILQRLHLILQCPVACPEMATPTLAGLCALWLLSAASSSGNLHNPAKPHAPQTTRPALPQPPVQAPPHMLLSTEAALDLTVAHGMPRTNHSHTDWALCAVVVDCTGPGANRAGPNQLVTEI